MLMLKRNRRKHKSNAVSKKKKKSRNWIWLSNLEIGVKWSNLSWYWSDPKQQTAGQERKEQCCFGRALGPPTSPSAADAPWLTRQCSPNLRPACSDVRPGASRVLPTSPNLPCPPVPQQSSSHLRVALHVRLLLRSHPCSDRPVLGPRGNWNLITACPLGPVPSQGSLGSGTTSLRLGLPFPASKSWGYYQDSLKITQKKFLGIKAALQLKIFVSLGRLQFISWVLQEILVNRLHISYEVFNGTRKNCNYLGRGILLLIHLCHKQ